MRMGPLCIRVGVLVRKGRDATDLSHYRQERDEDTEHSKKVAICKRGEFSPENKPVASLIWNFQLPKV